MLFFCKGAREPPTKPPAELAAVVDYVITLDPTRNTTGLNSVGWLKPGLKAADSGMGLSQQRAAYGVPANLYGHNASNVQMVWGTGTYGYETADLELFYTTYCPKCQMSKVGFDKKSVWNHKTGKNYVEGILDVSYLSGALLPTTNIQQLTTNNQQPQPDPPGMTAGVKTLVSNTNISTSTESGEGFGPALLSFLVDLNSRGSDPSLPLPLVLSLSLGSLSYAACDKLCTGVTKAGHTYNQVLGTGLLARGIRTSLVATSALQLRWKRSALRVPCTSSAPTRAP